MNIYFYILQYLKFLLAVCSPQIWSYLIQNNIGSHTKDLS